MAFEGFRGESLGEGLPRWAWSVDSATGERREPEANVYGWQRQFRAHGRHSFLRRSTAARGLAVGLLISTYVTYDRSRDDFAASTVSASRLAAQLDLKRTTMPAYLEDGMAGGWWLLEDQGRGRSRLITLTVPRLEWWNLDGPATKRPDSTPRDHRGQFIKTEPAPLSGATQPALPGGATSDAEERSEVEDLSDSAGNPTCPASGSEPARRTVDTCPTGWGTTDVTYEEIPTQITNGSPIGIDDERVNVRILQGSNAGAFTTLSKESADQLIAQGKAIAA